MDEPRSGGPERALHDSRARAFHRDRRHPTFALSMPPDAASDRPSSNPREPASRDSTPRDAAAPDGAPRDPALRLWVALARAYRAIEAHAAADVARHGLTVAEFGILEALHHKGRLLLGALGQTILVSSGGITFLVDRLERRGLVAREQCPDDRRARYATLTPEGRRFIARIFPEHAARLHAALGGLDAEEQHEAFALLRTLGMHAAGLPTDDAPARSPKSPAKRATASGAKRPGRAKRG